VRAEETLVLSDGKVTVGFGTVHQTVGAMRLLPNPRVPERLLDPVRTTASTGARRSAAQTRGR
jgi:hypothetical protein